MFDMSTIFGDYTAIAPLIFLIIGALILPGIHLLGKRCTVTWGVALALVIVSLIVNVLMLTDEYVGETLGIVEYNAYSGAMILLFQIVLFLAVLVSNSSVETTKLHVGAFYSLILAATTGMMFVVESSDLLTIFVGVELTSISSYALVSMKRNDSRAAEAAVKYVIIGGMSTALTIYGISMLYGMAGSTDIQTIADNIAIDGLSIPLAVGLVCMIAGYGFKIAAVPFHMWAPDVYEGAATPVSMFLATGSKKMGLSVFFQIFLVIFIAGTAMSKVAGPEMQYLFAIIAAVTMTVGNVVAIAQTNIKRMLAYSSIAQAGYILIVMAVMTEYAASAGMFHMFTHVFMKGGAFLIVGALICAGVGEKIGDYKGLAKRSPFLAAAMMLFLFSLAGIPPLAGFTSKFFLFSGAIGGPDGVMYEWVWLAFIAILNSAISLYYYARVVKAMYVEKGTTEEKIKIPKPFLAGIVICLVFVIVLGVYPQLLYGFCEAAASALLI
ncbi:MAG: NADH-quinone oxidoreductase subunit N [Candidatus Methanomethylophilaceae archaeon]|jgi:NADH-quinone oxidoreductase subunit N|nr:NADH-quinone oxidoreductase subunit N [Thermoplasmata archaeon]MBQ3685455.1 NADH-quinone oxidoreductase subunit N [Candidatus Methanomethylophilaceae archaeon]